MMSTYDLYQNGIKKGMMTIDLDQPIPPDPPAPPGIDDDVIISGTAGGGNVSLRAAKAFAGAFDSFQFNGIEMIDSADPGRLLQSAFTNQLAEAYNPTEGVPDGKVLDRRTSPGYLAQKAQIGFWQVYQGKVLSDYVLDKDITIGHPATEHCVQYLTTWHVPGSNNIGQFEVLTGYMPMEFGHYWSFDTITHDLFRLTGDEGMQGDPVIASNADGSLAMGIYSPDADMWYGAFNTYFPQGVAKWNIVRRYEPIAAGDYSFRCYVVFGTLENCRVSMVQLENYFFPPPDPPTPPDVDVGMPPNLPGQFFMSGLKTPKGFLLGTYKPAKLYLYDNAYHELLSLPTESVYMLYGPTPDGGYLFTTECPASVWRCSNDKFNDWHKVFSRPEPVSVAFDILPFQGGLSLFTDNQAWGNDQRIFKADINGNSWNEWRVFSGNLVQDCTDGQTLYLIGNKDRRPYIIDHNGNTILHADPSWKEQTINYASIRSGRFTLGLNNIEPLISDGTRRNGYVMSHSPFHSGIDLRPPFIMQTEAVDEGRFAIASIWNEGGYPNPELAWSKDGVTGWVKIADIPMPSVQTIEVVNGMVYCYGGQKNVFGGVYAHKL
jgi:hypothetical protein